MEDKCSRDVSEVTPGVFVDPKGGKDTFGSNSRVVTTSLREGDNRSV